MSDSSTTTNSIVTNAGLAAIAAARAAGTPLEITGMIFGYRGGLDPNAAPGGDFAIAPGEVVHTATGVNTSLLSSTSVAFSCVLGPAVGDFTFNMFALVSGDTQIAVAVQTAQYKFATSGFALGNTIIKNLAIEVANASTLAGISITGDPAALGAAVMLAREYAQQAARDRAAAEAALSGFPGKKLFDIFFSAAKIPPEGAAVLDGQVLSRTDYKEFYDRAVELADAGNLSTLTEAQYQSQLTTYKQCGSFVIDTAAQTIRLPRLTKYLQPGTPGVMHLPGLPNIGGSFGGTDDYGWDGAFSRYAHKGSYDNGDGRKQALVTFDASRSNPIYGRTADEVQTHSAEMLLCIQVKETGSAGAGGSAAVDPTSTEVLIPSLSGGTFLEYTRPLTSLVINQVVRTVRESYIQFTLDAGGSVTVPAEVKTLGDAASFEGGKSYLLGFCNGIMAVSEVV